MKNSERSELRIVAGEWRGRKLKFSGNKELRPTPDRVRETLFNWLQPDLSGSRCLDLFAGSGALGIEAASRGADSVLMVEKNSDAVAGIRQNIKLLKTDKIQVVCENAEDFIDDAKHAQRDFCEQVFDIVFMDPPYQSGLLGTCCELLEQREWLTDNAKIYVEYDIHPGLSKMPVGWCCLKSKKAGQVGYSLFQKINSL
jgi:16S rRNA (guanine966-N2)-methyltransferase